MCSFKSIDLASKPVFDKYTKNKYYNSETSFTNIFIWKDYFDVRYAETEGYLVVVYTDPEGRYDAYMPYGNGNFKACIDFMMKYFESCGHKFRIVSASLEMSESIKDLYPEIKITENINFNAFSSLSPANSFRAKSFIPRKITLTALKILMIMSTEQ